MALFPKVAYNQLVKPPSTITDHLTGKFTSDSPCTYPRSKHFQHHGRSALLCNNDPCRPADTPSHTIKAFNDPAGPFSRIGST